VTSDEDAFLAAITADPDDDTPRLVFADWLDERGTDDDRARAALIRAQCRAEFLPAGSPERVKLEGEAAAIVRRYEKRWTKPLKRLIANCTFRRGFLEGGSCSSATAFVRRGEELFRLAPTLRVLKFPYAVNEVTELAESPLLARLVSVDLTYMCTCGLCAIGAELRALFKSEHAANLRCLSVSRDRVDAGVARALARSPVLANLTDLDLSRNPLGPDGLRALLRAKHLTRLAALNLSGTALGNAGAKELADAAGFPALARLDLSDNGIAAGGAAALAASPLFRRLAAVNLSGNRVGEGGAAALAKLPAAAKLESLDVSGNELSAKALGRLRARFGKGVKAGSRPDA
jgi:uncharacterized protein (TIGR02996 family)